uniref:Tail fiber protein n=1 Tax=Caulobacter phage BL57 TaxID=3348355 RepID=A0AB74UKV6_9VIRU
MAIQNPHSTTPGVMPHLTPGEIGINKADDILWFRSEGRRVPIILSDLTRAPPATGYVGAPLALKNGQPIWDAKRAPSSVVNGQVKVDLPPDVGLHAMPSVLLTGLGSDRVLATNALDLSPFYVRSDSITITHLSFSVRSAGAPAMRVGIVDSFGVVQADVLVAAPAVGANVVALSPVLTLQRGTYRTILATTGNVTVGVVTGARMEQGWDIIGDAPSFIHGYSGSKNTGGGIGSLPALTPRRDSAPGQDHCVLMRWTA